MLSTNRGKVEDRDHQIKSSNKNREVDHLLQQPQMEEKVKVVTTEENLQQ
jgi:hypothetical protein